jgi:hypothetical protein
MSKAASTRREPGRYDLRGVPDFPVGSPPPSLNVRTKIAGVTDPNNPKRRQKVAVNRLTDILEAEYAHGRIGDDAYKYGRELQGVFEKGAGVTGRSSSSFEPQSGGDRSAALQNMIAAKIEDAFCARDTMEDLERDVGRLGARFLRRLLTGESSFAREAGQLASERQIAFQASRFRFYLAQLAEARLSAQTAVGRAAR